MSEKSRRLMEDLKERLSYAIDRALDGDLATGFAICEKSPGDIVVDTDTRGNESEIRLKCPYAFLKPKASIIISPKTKF